MDTSYLSQQVNTIIGQLHGLFDEIGVPNHDREAREADVRCCLLVWFSVCLLTIATALRGPFQGLDRPGPPCYYREGGDD